MIDLSGKKILVTGASSGIGAATVQMAANMGARLVLLARNHERLNQVFEGLSGKDHEKYECDITDYELVARIIKDSVILSGPFSGFVHSAGIEKTLPFIHSDTKVFKEVFEINVFAGFEIARLISLKGNYNPHGASFILISSVMGRKGETGKVAYCASKSALLSGSKALALELAQKKIRCNCILPGVVQTDMVKSLFDSIPIQSKEKIILKHPLGLGQPEDIASLICFLLSENARWITGSDFVIDGGYSS